MEFLNWPKPVRRPSNDENRQKIQIDSSKSSSSGYFTYRIGNRHSAFFINGKSVSDIKRIVLLVSVYRKQKANSFVNEKKVYFKHNKMGAGRMYEILDGSEGQ